VTVLLHFAILRRDGVVVPADLRAEWRGLTFLDRIGSFELVGSATRTQMYVRFAFGC